MRVLHIIPAVIGLLSAPVAAQTWVATRVGGTPVARIEQAGPITGLGFVCNGRSPLLSVQMARPLPTNRAEVRFVAGTQGIAQTLQRNLSVRQPLYIVSPVNSAVVTLMHDAPAGARLTVMIEGAPVATLSLDGAREAITAGLAACMPPPQLAAAPAAVQANVGRPGSNAPRPGTYVLTGPDGVECTALDWDSTLGYTTDWEPVWRVDPADPVNPMHRVIDANRFVWRDGNQSRTYRRCEDSAIPLDARYFAQADIRHLTALPIRPGLYRVRMEGEGPKYYMIDQTRIAFIEEAAWDRQGRAIRFANRVARLEEILQVAPRLYTIQFQRWPAQGDSDGKDNIPLLIEAPDQFTGFFGENGEGRFEPVSASQVPAAQRPHF